MGFILLQVPHWTHFTEGPPEGRGTGQGSPEFQDTGLEPRPAQTLSIPRPVRETPLAQPCRWKRPLGISLLLGYFWKLLIIPFAFPVTSNVPLAQTLPLLPPAQSPLPSGLRPVGGGLGAGLPLSTLAVPLS